MTIFWKNVSTCFVTRGIQIATILPSGAPRFKQLKTKLSNYTKPILDLKMSLDRTHQDLKVCLISRGYVIRYKAQQDQKYCRQGPHKGKILNLIKYVKQTKVRQFWVTFQVTLFPLFLQLLEKGPKPKLIIYKHVSDNSRKCLSVCR